MKIFIAMIVFSIMQSSFILSNGPLISLDRIIKNEKKIEILLKNRSHYRTAFTATKVGMGAFGVVQAVASTVNVAAWILGSNQRIQIAPVKYVESRNGWLLENALSLLKGAIFAVGSLGFYSLYAKVEQQYGAAPDVRWFVTVKSPFYITLRELYFLAQEASVIKKSQQLVAEMKERFAKLIDQTEQVVAFMRYKKELLSGAKKLEAEHVINHLVERIDQIYSDIDHALATDAYNVTFHLDSVLILLEGDCARFAQAEGSRWINPSAVLDIMQNVL